MITIDGSSDPEAQDILSALFGRLGDAIRQQESRFIFDFGSAHFFWDLPVCIPGHVARTLVEIKKTEPWKMDEGDYSDKPWMKLEDAVAYMLEKETTLNYGNFNRYVRNKRTRETISELFDHVTRTTGKPVVMPLPNWRFWKMDDCCNGHDFEFYDAVDERQLVEGFERVAKRKRVGGLILVNPTNPLLQDISEKACRAIDAIAVKYGVSIIVDEVMRGNRPLGDRDSIGRFFTAPYIVEGMSKRFGDRTVLEETSYVLAPKGVKLDPVHEPRNHFRYFAGTFLKAAMDYASEDALDELSARNRAFDLGISKTCPAIKLFRPFNRCLVTLLTLPQEMKMSAYRFGEMLARNCSIDTTPFDSFYPDKRAKDSSILNKLRITVGRSVIESIRDGSRILGEYAADKIKEANR
jgi:aspartate/methionine/tyrosine aminotransferase